MSETLIVCNACMHPVPASERTAHYRGEWHRYNVKRQVAGLPPMTADVFASKLSALQAKQGQEAQDNASHFCALCNKSCASSAAYLQHVNSKLHMKRVAKKDSKAASTSQNSGHPSKAESKQYVQESEEDDEVEDRIPHLIDISEEDRPKGIVYSNPKTRIVKVSKKQPEEDDEEEDFEFDEKNSIPLMSCLFCSRSFSTVDKSLQHMLTAHGFFIPFSEHLVDMEALLKYLGAKVGAGRVCLWCNGTSFADVRAIRQHMIDKGHCKINLDDDEDEFAEYYDFPEDEGDDSSELPIQDLNVANELVLANGAILGHREYRRVYRQNTRPESELAASDRAHRLLLGGAPHSGQLIASSRTEKQKRFSERQHHTKAFKNEVKSRLAHEYRANQQKHFVDQTGVY